MTDFEAILGLAFRPPEESELSRAEQIWEDGLIDLLCQWFIVDERQASAGLSRALQDAVARRFALEALLTVQFRIALPADAESTPKLVEPLLAVASQLTDPEAESLALILGAGPPSYCIPLLRVLLELLPDRYSLARKASQEEIDSLLAR